MIGPKGVDPAFNEIRVGGQTWRRRFGRAIFAVEDLQPFMVMDPRIGCGAVFRFGEDSYGIEERGEDGQWSPVIGALHDVAVADMYWILATEEEE